MSLSGKVISITGAASGIGLATAKLLATKGARLSLADAQEKPLQALADELEKSGYEIFSKVLDVRKRADVEQWVQNTVQKFGKLDGSVTIAGVAGKGVLIDRIQEIQDEDWDWVFDVNIKGTLNCLRAQIPNFNDGGSIVTIASVAGLTGMQKSAAYVASKHAVVGLSRVATVELGDRNIRVNCICPGPIQTPLLKSTEGLGSEIYEQLAPLKRRGDPREVATVIEWLLSDNSSYVTGTTQVVDGGFYNQ